VTAELNQLYTQYKAKGVEFKVVYISEAHAVDAWPVGDGREGSTCKAVNTPKTLAERIALAQMYSSDMKCQLPLFVDAMSNPVETALSLWPFRFYVVHQNKVWYKAMPNAMNTYAVKDLVKAINSLIE